MANGSGKVGVREFVYTIGDVKIGMLEAAQNIMADGFMPGAPRVATLGSAEMSQEERNGYNKGFIEATALAMYYLGQIKEGERNNDPGTR